MSRAMRVSKLWNNEEGSALLEGAIIVPFLFTLVLGALEFSYFFYQQHLVATGVRDAARYLARVADPTDPAAQTTAQNLASTGLPGGGSTRRIAGFDPADVTISFTFAANPLDGTTNLRNYRQAVAECGGPDQIRMIRVTGSFPPAVLGMLGYFGLSLPAVTVTHTERCIGLG